MTSQGSCSVLSDSDYFDAMESHSQLSDHEPSQLSLVSDEVLSMSTLADPTPLSGDDALKSWSSRSTAIKIGRSCRELFERLTPNIVLDESPSTTTSWKAHYAKVMFGDLRLWEDFNLKNIDDRFHGELDKPLPNWTLADDTAFFENFEEPPNDKIFDIRSEDDTNTLFRACLLRPLLKSVNFHGNNLRREMGMIPLEFNIGFEKTPIWPEKLPSDEKTPYKKGPDWPLFITEPCSGRDTDSSRRRRIFMFGDCKRSRVFHPDFLTNRDSYKASNCRNILGQMGMYAYYGNTKYAYICTPETVTVFSFYLISKTVGNLRMGAQHKSYKWNDGDDAEMIGVALFTLGLLCMDDNNRDVVSLEKLQPIDWTSRRGQGKVAEAQTVQPIVKCTTQDQHEKPPVDVLHKVQDGRVHKPRRKARNISGS